MLYSDYVGEQDEEILCSRYTRPMTLPEKALQNLADARRAVQLLRQTVDRRVHDPVISEAVEAVDIELSLCKSTIRRMQDNGNS